MPKKVIAPNQVLGRFFPGGPLPKRPNRPYGSKKAIEFKDFDKFYDEFFEQVHKDLTGAIKAPKTDILGPILKDINSAFKVSVKSPSEATTDYVPVEFADDLDDLPGAVSVSLNLSPYDRAKDPAKQSSTFLKSLVKGTFGYDIDKNTLNFTDVDSAIEKDFIWDPLVKGRPVGIGRLSSSGTTQGNLARILENKLTGKNPAVVGSLGTGTGLPDALGAGMVDFKSPSESYILGTGQVVKPGNPISNAQSSFIGGMGKFKSDGSRESAATDLNIGLLNVLDKEIHKDRDVSYILSPEANAVLNDRISLAHIGEKTPIIDLQSNDALTMYTKSLEKFLKTQDSQTKELAALGTKLVATTDPTEQAKIQSKIDALNAKVGYNDKKIDNTSVILLGDGTNPGLLEQAVGALQSSGAAEPVLTNLATKLDAIQSGGVAALSAEVSSGNLNTLLVDTRTQLRSVVDTSSTSFLFREQFNCLNTIHDFSKNLDKKLGEVSKFKFDEKDLPKVVTELDDSCKAQLKQLDDIEALLGSNPDALAEFEAIFGKHRKGIEKVQKELGKVKNKKDAKVLIKTSRSIYTTNTLGGGIEDVATRRFMESVFFGKGSLSDTFKTVPTEAFENSKRLYLISRKRYETESARQWSKMVDQGPKGLMQPIIQRYVKERVGLRFFDIEKPRQVIVENFLKPLHYFGLSYDAKIAADCKETGGFVGWLEKIGSRMTSAIGNNKFKVDLGTVKFSVKGNLNFGGGIALGKLLKSGVIDGAKMETLMNVKTLADLNSITWLAGVELPFKEDEDVAKFLAQIGGLKNWLQTDKKGKIIAAKLGITFSGGDIVVNGNLEKFFLFLAKMSLDPSATDPTAHLVGGLKKLSSFLSKVQTKWVVVVSAVRKPVVMVKTLIVEGLTQGVMAGLDAVTGFLGEILRVAVRVVVTKIVDWGELLIRGIAKFDLSEFHASMAKTVKGILSYIFYFVIAPLILFVFMLDSMDTVMTGVSPVDSSRTDGILLGSCTEIDARAAGVGTCGICSSNVGSVDWSPYSLGSATFTDGIAFVLDAAANDYNIPAPALGALFYAEGWSENVSGKFEQPWTYENVCDWSLEEGPLLPGCEDRTPSSDARGSFQWIPAWFDLQVTAGGVASKTPLPRDEYDPCNFLDATYAAAARFKELANAAGISGCGGDWLSPKGSIGGRYADGLPSTAPKIQWAILHYACGAGGGECFDPFFIDYSEEGLAVFNALKCF